MAVLVLQAGLVIPKSVKSIGQEAFKDCTGFRGSLIIPSGVQTSRGGTFIGCSGFDGLIIENSVKLAGGDFQKMSIRSCIIGEDVYLSGGIFYGNNKLESFYIPSSEIKKIYQDAFAGVNQSAVIYTDATAEDSSWYENWNSYGGGKLKVVYNTSLEQYKAKYNIEY